MKVKSFLGIAAALALSVGVAQAQSGIPITKSELPAARVTTSNGDIDLIGPLGYQLRPNTAPIYCSAGDVEEVARVQIKTELYDASRMISPEQAKALALCAVPGQISSGEMQSDADRTWYDISLLPTDKKTYTKIQIDAFTGEVINAKQFGGLRGLAGFLRESAERKENKVP